MANPAIIATPDGVWTKVATNVVTGQLNRLKNLPAYTQTYRVTGGGAPIDDDEGVRMFTHNKISEQIQSSTAIDVYVWCRGGDGSLRVDL